MPAYTSIKAILNAYELVATAVGHDLIAHDAEINLRRQFVLVARDQVHGVKFASHDLTKALDKCDTVDEMVKVLGKFVPDSKATRAQELLAHCRIDTEKLLGAFGYAEQIKVLKDITRPRSAANSKNGWATEISLRLQQKGVDLLTGGGNGDGTLSYGQKDAIWNVLKLVALSQDCTEDQTNSYWSKMTADNNYGFNELGIQVPVVKKAYKNGNVSLRLPSAACAYIADVLATRLWNWAKAEGMV